MSKYSHIEEFLKLKQERLNSEYDSERKVLDFGRYQAPSPSENKLKTILFKHLLNTGFSGEISHQEVLPISTARVRKLPYFKEHQNSFSSQFTGSKNILRIPDFLCIKYGFVIEVDGLSHLGFAHRRQKDETRELEYKAMGLDIFVIENDDIYDPEKLSCFIKKVILYIKEKESRPDFEKDYQKRRTAISRARKSLRKDIALRQKLLLGKYNRKNPKPSNYPSISQFPNIKTTIQNGGYRYLFKPQS